MDEKKIEPTDAMVEEALSQCTWMTPDTTRTIMRTALNHPDARGLFTDEDDRPWEPLNGRTPRVGDEVRQDLRGITRIAVVASLDGDGDPWAAEGDFIGVLQMGAWYVRRTVQGLPTEPGAVIVPADGHDYIEATMDNGEIFRAREAIRSRSGAWYAAWRFGERQVGVVLPEAITPGTWKVDDQ